MDEKPTTRTTRRGREKKKKTEQTSAVPLLTGTIDDTGMIRVSLELAEDQALTEAYFGALIEQLDDSSIDNWCRMTGTWQLSVCHLKFTSSSSVIPDAIRSEWLRDASECLKALWQAPEKVHRTRLRPRSFKGNEWQFESCFFPAEESVPESTDEKRFENTTLAQKKIIEHDGKEHHADEAILSESTKRTRLKEIQALLAKEPSSDYAVLYPEIKRIGELTRSEMASRLTPAFNAMLQSMPQETYEDKKQLCRFANAQLHAIGLSIASPDGSESALLVASSDPDPERGRFRLRTSSKDAGVRFPKSSVNLFEVQLIPASERVEAFSLGTVQDAIRDKRER